MGLRNLQDRLWKARYKIGVWGYLVEAWVYARAMFRQSVPRIRFVIFAQGRTGSQLLCDLLDAHPQICCQKEILNQPVFSPRRMMECSASLTSADAYGFKVKIDQLTDRQNAKDVRGFLRDAQRDGWKIIFLERRNLLRHSLSGILRLQTGRSHRYRSRDGQKPQTPKLHVDCRQIVRAMEAHRLLSDAEAAALRGLEHLHVVYEDDLYTHEDQQKTIKRLCGWLGIAYTPVQTDLVRIAPPRIADLVENYDELRAAIRGTEWAPFLDDGI